MSLCILSYDYYYLLLYDLWLIWNYLARLFSQISHWLELNQRQQSHTLTCPDPQTERCKQLLSVPAFFSCKDLLDMDSFVEACVMDLCNCNNNISNGTTSSSDFCLCPTLSEYSRQCAHAGGTPQTWETAQLCGKNRNNSSSTHLTKNDMQYNMLRNYETGLMYFLWFFLSLLLSWVHRQSMSLQYGVQGMWQPMHRHLHQPREKPGVWGALRKWLLLSSGWVRVPPLIGESIVLLNTNPTIPTAYPKC